MGIDRIRGLHAGNLLSLILEAVPDNDLFQPRKARQKI